MHKPRGEHHTKRAFPHKHALTGSTTRAYSFKRHALLRLPYAFLGLMRVTHARPLNPAANFELVLSRMAQKPVLRG